MKIKKRNPQIDWQSETFTGTASDEVEVQKKWNLQRKKF